MAKFLDAAGVAELWAKVKEQGATAVRWLPIPNTLGELVVGDTITLNETVGGTKTEQEFIVAEKDYNGSGRVLLLRKNLIGSVKFGSTHNYAGGTLDTYCNETYLSYLDEDVRAQIANVPIESASSNTATVNTLSRKCFVLSGREVGLTSTSYADEGDKLAYFLSGTSEEACGKRKATLDGAAKQHWTRSPIIGSTSILCIYTDGGTNTGAYSSEYPVRPAFTLPDDFVLSYTNKLADGMGNPLGVNAQVAYGTYKGTGTYGQSNPCSLTFDFVPAIVIIQYSTEICVMMGGSTGWATRSSYNDGTAYQMMVAEWGKTVKWWTSTGSSATYQFNGSGYTYRYIAIG